MAFQGFFSIKPMNRILLPALAFLCVMSAWFSINLRAQEETPAAPSQIVQTLSKNQLETIVSELKATPPADEKPMLTRAKKTTLEARKIARQAEANMLTQEEASLAASVRLLNARISQKIRQVSQLESRVKTLQEAMNALREAETRQAEKDAERAKQEAREAVNKHPAVRELIEENAKLTQTLAEIKADFQRRDLERQDLAARLNQITDNFSADKKRWERAGLRGALGEFLLERRKKLPDVRPFLKETGDIKTKISEVGLSQLNLKENLKNGAEIVERIETIMSRADVASRPEYLRVLMKADLENQLKSQFEKRIELDSLYSNYFDLLINLDEIQNQFVEATRRTDQPLSR